MQQMTELFAERQCSILAVQEVPEDQTNRYGIVKGEPLTPDLLNGQGPDRETAPKRCPIQSGGGGPLHPDPGGFDLIRVQPRGAGGEIQLTDGIAALLASEQCWPTATMASVTTVAANSA
jgi:UTP--glucose-1-phosphate uridylyltransferase